MVQYEIKVSGRVQGVWFRYFVQQRANELGIKGWVKNTSDGRVIAMAQGEQKHMETLFEHLQVGPPMARVTGIVKNRMPELENFADFRIVY